MCRFRMAVRSQSFRRANNDSFVAQSQSKSRPSSRQNSASKKTENPLNLAPNDEKGIDFSIKPKKFLFFVESFVLFPLFLHEINNWAFRSFSVNIHIAQNDFPKERTFGILNVNLYSGEWLMLTSFSETLNYICTYLNHYFVISDAFPIQ